MNDSPPVPRNRSTVRAWIPVAVMLAVLYVVGTPPVYYVAARTGLVYVPEDPSEAGAVDSCIAPARWLYEDSPLKPVLKPWAEFWYDVLLT